LGKKKTINVSSDTQRWYVVGLGSAINGVAFAMSWACMPVLFEEISRKLHLDVVQIGVVWGFGSIAAIFSIFAAGFLADRFGARRVLAVACILAAVFGALRGLSNSYATLTITSLLFGMVSEAMPVIVIKNVTLWSYGKGLGTAQGIITAVVAGGMLLSTMISATLLSPWLGGWQYVTYFYAAITLVVGILWAFTAPAPPAAPAMQTEKHPPFLQSARRVLGHGNVWLIAIAMMLFAGSNKGVFGYLPLYLSNSGWSTAGADGALSLLNAAGMAAAVPFALLSDKIGNRKKVVVPGVILTIIGLSLLSAFTGPEAWGLIIVAGLSRDVIWAMSTTMVVETEGIGPAYAGMAVGIVQSFSRIGYAFAPPAGNSLASVFQSGSPFLFWAALALASLAIFLFIRERRSDRSH
jgi:NNP family nitrate/nitrite transporter-like MFS transporter